MKELRIGRVGGEGDRGELINERGAVVGEKFLERDDHDLHSPRVFVWSGGHALSIASLPGRPYSLASGLNDRGQVVGWCSANNQGYSDFYGTPGRERAFVWQRGKTSALGKLGANGGWAAAYDVNDRNQIVGEEHDKNGRSHAVLWTLER